MVDDYGHHPAEIRATLLAARRGWLEAPHRRRLPAAPLHARAALLDDFARAFNEADVLVVTDIYPAGEAPMPGVDAARRWWRRSASTATTTSRW